MSPGRIVRRPSPITAISPSTVRAAAERSAALGLLTSFSIGLRSRLYAGRSRTSAPAARISRRTSAVLWMERRRRGRERPRGPTRRPAIAGHRDVLKTAEQVVVVGGRLPDGQGYAVALPHAD